MKTFGKWIFWIGLLCTTLEVLGQEAGSFQYLSKKDGLSQASVFAIVQDSAGFMWFGTRNGLNRFDGYQFKIYKKDASAQSLVADDIRILYVDPQTHDLWIGTILGLNKYHVGTDKFTTYLHSPTDSTSISNNIIREIFRDSKGRLWIGTALGVNLFNDEKNSFERFAINYKSTKKVINLAVRAILEDTSGQIWFGTSDGLFRLLEGNDDSYSFERVNGVEGLQLSHSHIQHLVEDHKGNLWIGTEEKGLYYWDMKTEETTIYQSDINDPTSLSGNSIRAMCMDQNHNFWVGTFHGLNLLEEGKTSFKIFKKEKLGLSGISDNSIHSLFLDRQGSLWVGTFYGGVNHLNETYNHFTNFEHIPFRNSLSADVVSSFAEDEKGNLWIGTDGGGLNYYDREKNSFENFQFQPGKENALKGNKIKKLLLDEEHLWIGTFQAGLSLLDLKNKSFQHFQNDPLNPNSLSLSNVYGLHREKDKLWIATYGKGIDILDLTENKFYHFRKDANDNNSISSDLTRVILETKDKQLWIGTEKGLNKVTKDSAGFPSRFETYLADERIYALQESWNQKIWIGTYTNGLFYLNPTNGVMEQFTTANGLPGNSIIGILEGSDNELWLSTNNGLSKFNYVDKSFTNYDHSNGLANLEYNFNAYYKTRSGELLFGGINGFTLFHPMAIQTNKYVPPVVFTELRRNNQVIDLRSANTTITFNYNEANFSIGFAALDYISPENNRYKFKLEGLDRDWNYTVGKTEATYTIQRDGEYIFRLQGANSDGVWNLEEQQLNIVVLPPPWRTWWAYLIYVAVLGAIIFALIRYIRLRHRLQLEQIAKLQQEELHEVKLRFFTNITHEFRTPLTLILGPLKELISKETYSESVGKKLKSIQSNTQRLLNLVNQVLTFRKLATDHEPMKVVNGNLVDFLKEIFLPFQETARLRNISYHFKTEKGEITAWYDPDKLEKVFFNLLANAFKFTPDGGKIKMHISHNEEYIEVSVADNGIGIEPELHEQIFKRFYEKAIANRTSVKGTGIGLAISKQMVELHHGKIFVEKNSPDPTYQKGATFVVQIPLGSAHLNQETIIQDFSDQEKIENYSPLPIPQQSSSTNSPSAANLKKEDLPLLLIVEDNAEIRAYIQQIFVDKYQIITAEDGLEGLEKTKKHAPQLIISDVMMPRMDGITFCGKLKADLEISHIPIILLTARTASIFKIEGLKTGADDYVTKPFDPEELLLRVHNITQARQEVRDKFARVLTFDPKEISITSADESFLINALQIVEDNIENLQFNVLHFAADLAVSRPLLFTKLKALTGQTPNNFIKTIRLKRAAQLLKTQKLNVSEVAYKVGFKDPKYFRKCFKDQFDELPSEFSRN